MNTKTSIYMSLVLFLLAKSVLADVGFTQQDLNLVRSACLAGDSFVTALELNGNISVKSLSGKGKLSANKTSVTTVDLPDINKSEEFKEIRACIQLYLIDNNSTSQLSCNDAQTFSVAIGGRPHTLEGFSEGTIIGLIRINRDEATIFVKEHKHDGVPKELSIQPMVITEVPIHKLDGSVNMAGVILRKIDNNVAFICVTTV